MRAQLYEALNMQESLGSPPPKVSAEPGSVHADTTACLMYQCLDQYHVCQWQGAHPLHRCQTGVGVCSPAALHELSASDTSQ